jgi:hypothetical protein
MISNTLVFLRNISKNFGGYPVLMSGCNFNGQLRSFWWFSVHFSDKWLFSANFTLLLLLNRASFLLLEWNVVVAVWKVKSWYIYALIMVLQTKVSNLPADVLSLTNVPAWFYQIYEPSGNQWTSHLLWLFASHCSKRTCSVPVIFDQIAISRRGIVFLHVNR